MGELEHLGRDLHVPSGLVPESAYRVNDFDEDAEVHVSIHLERQRSPMKHATASRDPGDQGVNHGKQDCHAMPSTFCSDETGGFPVQYGSDKRPLMRTACSRANLMLTRDRG